MYNSGLLLLVLRNLHRIDFEGKKDAVQIFNNIYRMNGGKKCRIATCSVHTMPKGLCSFG